MFHLRFLYHQELIGRKLISKANQKEELLLVKKAASGDKQAFQVLVERYQSRVYYVALNIMKTHEDAEEVLQEAFVKAYFAISKFKGESSFYTWLYRIVRNMAIDVKRKHKSRGGDKLELTELTVAKSNTETPGLGITQFKQPDEELMQKRELKKVSVALDSLSEEHREAITMREVDGLSYDEIANVLKISRGTVMSRIFYARKKLQEFLKNSVSSEIATSSKKKVCIV